MTSTAVPFKEKKHTTHDEKLYIGSIGLFHTNGAGVSCKDVLIGYIKGCEKRANWNGINKLEILDFANQQLALLQ